MARMKDEVRKSIWTQPWSGERTAQIGVASHLIVFGGLVVFSLVNTWFPIAILVAVLSFIGAPFIAIAYCGIICLPAYITYSGLSQMRKENSSSRMAHRAHVALLIDKFILLAIPILAVVGPIIILLLHRYTEIR
jgi:hypothetical protein